MKKTSFFWALCCSIFLIIFLFSCTKDCDCPGPTEPEEPEKDYHLVYGPAGDPEFYGTVFSTRTGEMIDSIPLLDTLFSDVCFTSDGLYAIYSGWALSDSRNGLVWVENYLTGKKINIIETRRARKVEIDNNNEYILIGEMSFFGIFTYPDLDTVYAHGTSNNCIGFFSDYRAYYFDAGIDSFIVVDYSNPDSVYTTSYQFTDGIEPVNPSTAVFDSENNKLIFWAEHYIQTYDADSMTKISQLRTGYNYNGSTLRPNSDQVYFYYSDDLLIIKPIIHLYNINSNSLQHFMDNEDYVTGIGLKPRLVEFTPDGDEMYILNSGGGSPETEVAGIRMSDKLIINYFHPLAYGLSIAINPRNFYDDN